MKITNDHADLVCHLGTGEQTCSFLTLGANGFECAKGTEVEQVILKRRAEGTMKAKGDCCSGPPDFVLSQ